jgi:RND family efflux transporter MFP subunit
VIVKSSVIGLMALTVVAWSAAGADDPAQVTAKPLRELAVYPPREAPAAVVSLNDARISAEVGAVIVELPVQIGEIAEAGAVIARLDPHDYRLGVERAEAALAVADARVTLADSQLARVRDLKKSDYVSDDLLTQRTVEQRIARAEQVSARAQLAAARRHLERCTLTAPYRAVIMERIGQVGELAAPGGVLMRLIDVSALQVSAQVAAQDAESLAAATEVMFADASRDWPVALLRISPAIDLATRSREARLTFAGEHAPVGASGRLAWRDHRPQLPAELLSRRDGRLGVFVVERSRARFIALPGAQEGRPAPAGLPADSRVIVEGRHGLQDGQAIAVN